MIIATRRYECNQIVSPTPTVRTLAGLDEDPRDEGAEDEGAPTGERGAEEPEDAERDVHRGDGRGFGALDDLDDAADETQPEADVKAAEDGSDEQEDPEDEGQSSHDDLWLMLGLVD
jgi:hypothetical protein